MSIPKENAMQELQNLYNDLSELVLQQLDILERILNEDGINIPAEVSDVLNANEERIDHFEIQITEEIINTIVLQSPVASDLRKVMAFYQMVSNLERIGDSVINIVHVIPKIQDVDVYKRMSEVISNMMMSSINMVRKSIQSFVLNEKEDAIWTLKNDEEVDAMKHKLIKKAIMKSDLPEETQHLLFTFIHLNSIVSNIERIADHATNIAEASIYSIEGRDLRHQKDIED
jgi:phosphate transport system protein